MWDDIAKAKGCDLMLFENREQSPLGCHQIRMCCDLMLFENREQYLSGDRRGREVVI